jgi:hypothetical protein
MITRAISFKDRLKAVGFDSYEEYLRSDHWAEVHKSYRMSGLPQECMACGDYPFQLHHRSYRRLGHEDLSDVIPLCRSCHYRLHAHAKEYRLGVERTTQVLQDIFHWTDAETVEKFRPFGLKEKKFHRPPAEYLPPPKPTRQDRVGKGTSGNGPKKSKAQRRAERKKKLRDEIEAEALAAKKAEIEREQRTYLPRMAARYTVRAVEAAMDKDPVLDPYLKPALLDLINQLRKKGEVA